MPKGRKHSTAHFSPNGTIYILGGTESTNNSQLEFASPLLTLHFKSTDLSLHSSASTLDNHFLPSIGHTSHIISNNTLISVFGLHPLQYKDASSLIPSSIFSKHNSTHPSNRYGHTSLLMNHDLYIIGGILSSTHQQVHDVIWKYSLSKNTWIQLPSSLTLSNHVSFAFRHWIISCFGKRMSSTSNGCVWFDTINSHSTVVRKINPTQEWPNARIYASITTLPHQSSYVLFGGENEKEILDDLWQLDLNKPFEMKWKRLESSGQCRSGHAEILMNDLILYYGGQTDPWSLADEPLYLNTTTRKWIHKTTAPYYQLDVPEAPSNIEKGNNKQGLGSGAIAGIVIGIVVILVLGAGAFLWRKYKVKHTTHSKSRAARFSHSPSNTVSLRQLAYMEKTQSTHTDLDNNKNRPEPFLSLPELAVTNTNNSRISSISLGAEFKFTTEEYYHRQSSRLSCNNLSRQSLSASADAVEKKGSPTIGKSLDSQDKKPETNSTTGLKRMTLNLFSNNTADLTAGQPSNEKGAQSGIFQLRGSRFLQPKAPEEVRYSGLVNNSSRTSFGGKSVASVQWVGFNDNMDYKGSLWRDSSSSSLHLAVKNAANRTSSYYTTESTQSTPISPMFPHHLRDSAVLQYHQDNNSRQSMGSK